MSNKPRYRLKKDWITPGLNNFVLPAGTPFDKFCDNSYRSNDGWVFHKDRVEKDEEWFERIEEPREWEVVDVKDTISNLVYPFNSADNERFKIHSVKILPDGAIFTVGDKVKWEFTVDRPTEFQKIDEFVFHKSSGKMNAHCRCKNLTFDIAHIQHYKEPAKDFVWDDEKVLAFAYFTFNQSGAYKSRYQDMKDFKENYPNLK